MLRWPRYDPGPCIVCCAPHCTCVSPDYTGPGVVTTLPPRRGLPRDTPIVIVPPAPLWGKPEGDR